ncbi:hypothetical protein STEG23_016931 [Scotinomys teguina]
MCQLSWFLDPGGWGKAAAVGLYFIFPGICTLSLIHIRAVNQAIELKLCNDGRKNISLTEWPGRRDKERKRRSPGQGSRKRRSQTAMKTRCRSYREATEHVAADRGPKMG